LNKLKNIRFNKKKAAWIILILLLIVYWFSLPTQLFKSPLSTVLEDKDGNLLGAKIADDGQWRFPNSSFVPEKFEKALMCFEDKNFYRHPGFNPFSLSRAVYQNIKSSKRISGGSTLTMQVIRLSRNNKRSYLEKAIEIILSTRLEISYSKKEILSLYASNAPFGGNVVGLDAASWRYFGRGSDKLSWAEAATLAVLPNSPKLIYPGRNEGKLKIKRDRLLDKLLKEGSIDKETCELSKKEPLPLKPLSIPQLAPHLVDRAMKDGNKEQIVQSTLDIRLQQQVNEIVEKHHKQLQSKDINNAAALVMDVETGNILAYVGNTHSTTKKNEGYDVDIISSPRSTGSILKPILFAGKLNDGELLPATLIPDVPTEIAGYSPKNFDLSYNGAVPAKKALARSLNVPAVRMLQEYKYERFYRLLKKLGMTTLNNAPDHYGLSLILGGAEGSLWDLAGIYGSMSRSLNHYNQRNIYVEGDYHPPCYLANTKEQKQKTTHSTLLDAASLYLMFEAILEVSRPEEESSWRYYTSSQKIAWKTGTSFGFRDAWAIGTTPKYVVAVWVGNADGEGRPDLTGIGVAAPILFDIFSLLKPSGWYKQPIKDMVPADVCMQSGMLATANCESVKKRMLQKNSYKTLPCKYCQLIHTDASGKYRVTSDCEDVNNMLHKKWFVLPPAMEWYYKTGNPVYKTLPPFRNGCNGVSSANKNMELIYPKGFTRIFVPIEITGKLGKTVFELAHKRSNARVYWHLDNDYLTTTEKTHQYAFAPSEGKHTLTLVDDKGEVLTQVFEVIGKRK
jgi:penicillin-binding protein 1C